MKTAEVVTAFGGGSSEWGITSLMNDLECALCAKLDREARRKGEQTSSDSKATIVGTLLHWHLKNYYDPTDAVHILDDEDDDVLQECRDKAWTLFRGYRGLYSSKEFGRPRGVERFVDGVPRPFPSKFTMRLDLEIKPTPAVCTQLNKTGLVLRPNYWYIVDHKTCKGFLPGWEQQYLDSIQLNGYCYAYQLKYPRRKFGGLIVNAIAKNLTRPDIRRVLVPPPDLNHKRAVAYVCEEAILIRYLHFLKPNPTFRCHFPSTCKWLHNGCEKHPRS